jgi:HEAT repeat protein
MRWQIPTILAVALVAGCSEQPQPLLSHGKPVAHWLLEMRRPEAAARKKAVRALGHVGNTDSTALAAIVEAVRDRDAAVRSEAIVALMNLGPSATDAVPALKAATSDRDTKVRTLATKALERIQGGN